VINNDERGIVAYLATEAPGIGDKLARELYRIHGSDTLNVLANPDIAAASTKGLSLPAAEKLAKWIQDNQNILLFKTRLYGIGLKPALISKLLNTFGKEAEKELRKDCFALTEIKGIGWETVNNIADLLHLRKDDDGRIKAAVVYALESLEQDGHSCCTVKQLIEAVTKLLGFFHDKIQEQIEFACQQGLVMRGGGSYDISYFGLQEKFNDKNDVQSNGASQRTEDGSEDDEWGVSPDTEVRYSEADFDRDYDENQPRRDAAEPTKLSGESEWKLPWDGTEDGT
jgi:ATP-dependent exoDNAse (exonuclease V) alpha subunit